MGCGIYPNEYVRDVDTASTFVVCLINVAMKKYGATFEQIDAAMKQSGLWDRINDIETAVILAASPSIDEYLQEIEQQLKKLGIPGGNT